MTKAEQMKIRAQNPLPQGSLTSDNLKNLDNKPQQKKFEAPLRNQEPIQMERSPPRGLPKKHSPYQEEYIGGIQSIENI